MKAKDTEILNSDRGAVQGNGARKRALYKPEKYLDMIPDEERLNQSSQHRTLEYDRSIAQTEAQEHESGQFDGDDLYQKILRQRQSQKGFSPKKAFGSRIESSVSVPNLNYNDIAIKTDHK